MMRRFTLLFIIIAGGLLFIPFLGAVHLFDWDEINFAECAREMLVTGNYSQVQINFQPFWEKPPLFFWLQILSMKAYGVNEFAARLPNAIAGIIGLCILFLIGKKKISRQGGLWWVLAYAGSFLPFFYFKSGIIDPWFNLFTFLGIYFLSEVFTRRKNNESALLQSILGGFFFGLAVLTKGPVAFLIGLISFLVFAVMRWRALRIKAIDVAVFIFCLIIITSAWFLPQLIQQGPWFLQQFIAYQIRLLTTPDSTHGGNFFYHWYVLLLGCFPASVLFFPGFFGKREHEDDFTLWMKILFWVVLILFSVVRTKIIHYSSLCYYPISFFAAKTLSEFKIEDLKKWQWRISKILFVIIGVCSCTALLLIPFLGRYPSIIYQHINDPFAYANLKASVAWPPTYLIVGYSYLAVIFLALIFIIRKKIFPAFYFLLPSTALVSFFALWLFVPKIEQYTQNGEIEFYQAMKNQNCYLQPLGFKSYAHSFYGERKPSDYSSPLFIQYLEKHGGKTSLTQFADPNQFNNLYSSWLLSGVIDKPAYFVSKNTMQQELSKTPGLVKLGERNGYIFWWRDVTLLPIEQSVQ